jgi:hypothetical protein
MQSAPAGMPPTTLVVFAVHAGTRTSPTCRRTGRRVRAERVRPRRGPAPGRRPERRRHRAPAAPRTRHGPAAARFCTQARPGWYGSAR